MNEKVQEQVDRALTSVRDSALALFTAAFVAYKSGYIAEAVRLAKTAGQVLDVIDRYDYT